MRGLMPWYHIVSSLMGQVEARESTKHYTLGRIWEPRAQDPLKDMDLIILTSLKSVRKLWMEAEVSSFQIMLYFIVNYQ